MASSAIEIRSPAVSSMSSSRPGGSGLTWCARSSSSSVVSPMADTITHTSLPALRVATMRSATRLIRSASDTEEPPYFCTTSPTCGSFQSSRRRRRLILPRVPGGGLGGTADVAIAGTKNGLYQCALAPPGGCVRVAGPDGALPTRNDPRVHHLFTDWLGALGNRDAALSVASSAPLPGIRGQ